MNTLAERLEFLLKSRGLNHNRFCQLANYNTASLSKIFTENRKPKGNNLHIILNFFGVNEAWLVGGIEPMYVETNNNPITSPNMDTEYLMQQLKELLDEGILTQQEYDVKKKAVLDKYK